MEAFILGIPHLLSASAPDLPTVPMTDWRVDNAKRTRGATLRLQKYIRHSDVWEHEHCVGCWAKFMETKVSPEILTEGYVTEDDHWVCPECFGDLREIMEWKLVS